MSEVIKNIEPKKDKIKFKRNGVNHKIIINDKRFNSKTLIKLIESLEFLKKINYRNLINIIAKSEMFTDDGVIIVLEKILYDYITNYNMKINISFENLRKQLTVNKLYDVSLINKCIIDNKLDNELYVEKYQCYNIITDNYFRKNIDRKNRKIKNAQSIVLQDIYSYLKNNGLSESYSKDLSKAISEIVDNVISHTLSNPIFTLKIFQGKIKEGETVNLISVSIINFSNEYIYTGLKEKYYHNELSEKTKNIISKAYNNNKRKLNKDFDEDGFYFISAFQKDVTTREKSIGGTGLTILLKNLINNSKDDYCYVISGNNYLKFQKEILQLNNDGTIGFNKNNDYYNDIPDLNYFKKLKYTFNGTLFSLVFIS